MSKIIRTCIVALILALILTACQKNIELEQECIAKPPLPEIQLDRLIFPKMSGKIYLNVEDQLVCLPLDDFIQTIDNNKQISSYIQRCNLIKDTYEDYYGIEIQKPKK